MLMLNPLKVPFSFDWYSLLVFGFKIDENLCICDLDMNYYLFEMSKLSFIQKKKKKKELEGWLTIP